MRAGLGFIGVALAAFFASTASAVIRETVTPTGGVGGPGTAADYGLVGNAQNETISATFTGMSGGVPYQAKALRMTGTLTTTPSSGSYQFEASFLVTPPNGGTPFVMTFNFPGSGGTSTVASSYAAVPVNGDWNAAGTWTFQAFDLYDDAGPTGKDATWTNLTFSLDDATPDLVSPPSGAEAVTLNNIPSDGTQNFGGNSQIIHINGGYTAAGYALTGVIEATSGFAASDDRSPCSDVLLRVTPPGGTPVLIAPTVEFTQSPATANISIQLPTAMDPAGDWLVEFFEYQDDPGIDNVWTSFTLTMLTPAAPASTSLGTLAPGVVVSHTDPVTGPGKTIWYSFTIPAVDASAGTALDIDTEGSVLSPDNDTTIALYDSDGNRVAVDGDTGSGLLSQLSFGRGGRAAIGDGSPYNGQNSDDAAGVPAHTLPAGTYYLAVTNGSDSSFSPGLFGVNSPATNANTGTVTVNVQYFTNVAPITPPPAIAMGTLSPGTTDAVGTMDGNGLLWFSFTIPFAIDSASSPATFLDIDTGGSSLAPYDDTLIALYDSNGFYIAYNDDIDTADGLYESQLSFGATTPARGPAVAGETSDDYPVGADGTHLDAGTYYLVVQGFPQDANPVFPFDVAGFNVLTSDGYTGQVAVHVHLGTVSDAGGSAPGNVTELGDIEATTPTTVVTNTQPVAAGGVAWFHFSTSLGADAGSNQYFDIDTEGSTLADTEMVLISDDGIGTIVASDDNDGSGLLSQLTFGAGTRPAHGDGMPYDGRDGATIFGGSYYIGVASAPASFGSSFSVFNAGGSAGNVTLNIHAGVQSATPVGCNPADIVSVGQQPPPDGLLTGDDYVAFINAFFTGNLLADIVSVGQQPPPDGLLTGDDYVAFINNFFIGCH